MEEGKSKQGLWGLITVFMAIVLLFGAGGLISAISNISWMFAATLDGQTISLLIFENVASILIAAASIYLLVLFFKKSKKFPKHFTYFIIAAITLRVVGSVISLAVISKSISLSSQVIMVAILQEMVLPLLFMFAWIISIPKSERIKQTFVH